MEPLHGNLGSRMEGGFWTVVGTLRDPSSSPTLVLRRRWASVGKRRSRPGSTGRWTSRRGVSTRACWGMPRWKGPPGREGPPVEGRRKTRPWQETAMPILCLVSLRRTSVGQMAERGEGASSRTTNAQKPGYRLQRSSGRSTRTCVSPLWKPPRAQPSRSMGK